MVEPIGDAEAQKVDDRLHKTPFARLLDGSSMTGSINREIVRSDSLSHLSNIGMFESVYQVDRTPSCGRSCNDFRTSLYQPYFRGVQGAYLSLIKIDISELKPCSAVSPIDDRNLPAVGLSDPFDYC